MDLKEQVFYTLKTGVKVENLISGGGQEKYNRAGTKNVAGIIKDPYRVRASHRLSRWS